MRIQMSLLWLRIDLLSNMFLICFIKKTKELVSYNLLAILTDQKRQFWNYHINSQIEILNPENPFMLIAQIYYLTLNVREL